MAVYTKVNSKEINYIEKNNIYTEKEILDLKIFLSNPNKWRENNG